MAVEAAGGEDEEESVMGSLSALHRRERSRREKKRVAPPQPTNQDSEPATMPGYILFAPFFHFFCTIFTIQSPNWNSKDEKNKLNGFEKFFQIRKSKKNDLKTHFSICFN
jgi:hypothetical protein